MAPVLAASFPVYSAAADTTTLTKTGITVTSGDVLVAKGTTWGTADGLNAPVTSGQTWQQVGIAAPGAFNAWAGLWVCTVSGSPGTVDVSMSPATGNITRHSMVVERWTGAQLAGSPATNSTKSGTGTTATTTLTTVGANSAVSWCMADENSRDPAASTYVNTSGTPTQDGLYDGHIGANSVHYFATQDAATAGSQTFGVTNASALAWVAVGVEIEAGSSTVNGSASLAAAGTLTAAATTTALGIATVSGTGTLTASGAATALGTAPLGASGSLTASGKTIAYGTVALSASGRLTVQPGNVDITATIGPPQRSWTAGPPENAWSADTPARSWTAGPPQR